MYGVTVFDSMDFVKLKQKVDFVDVRIGTLSDNGLEITFMAPDKFATIVQSAYDAGLAVGASIDLPIGYFLSKQYTMNDVEKLSNDKHPIVAPLLRLLRNKAISFLVMRIEPNSVKTNSGQVTDAWVSFVARDVYERCSRLQRDGQLRGFPLAISGSYLFLSKYPSLDVFLTNRFDMLCWVRYTVNATFNQSLDEALKYDLSTVNNGKTPPFIGWSDKRIYKTVWNFWSGAQFEGATLPVHFYKGDFVKDIKAAVKPAEPVQPPVEPPVEPPAPPISDRKLEEKLDALMQKQLELEQILLEIRKHFA